MKRLKLNQQVSRCWVALAAGLAMGGLEAGQLTWTGQGDGTSWSDAANWNATPNWSEANDLDFTAVAGGATIHNDATTTFGIVTFGADKGTIVWTADKTVKPKSGTIKLPAGTTLNAQFAVGQWGWSADSWNLTVSGGGTLWIAATWTGGMSGGTFTLDGVTAVMKTGLTSDGAGELALKNGAQVTVEKSFTVCRLTSESVSDKLTLGGGLGATLLQAKGTFAGTLAGAGTFALRGGETWTLSGDSPDFTGTFSLRETRLNVTGSLGPQAKIVNVETGTLIVSHDQTVAGVSGDAAVGGIEIAEGKTLTVTDGGAYGARLSGAGTFALDASGKTLTLSGANTLTGTVRVKAGTLIAADTAGAALSGYPAGLVSRYSFDGDLTTDDLGANGLKVASGAPTSVADGLGGSRCVRFDGAAKMQTAANTFIKEKTPFTISFWVRTTSTDTWTNGGCFLRLGNWTSAEEQEVVLGATTASGQATGSLMTLQGNWVPQSPWQNGGWRQYALTFDGTVLTLYTNGENPVTKTKAWNLGNTPLTFGDKVVADYDELLVFNRALSADEVKALSENPFPAPTAEAATDPAPVAHWAFNDAENPGKDTSGNGYDLEVVGGTLSLTSDADDYGSAARFTKDGAYLKLSGTGLPAKFPSGGASFTVNVRMSGTGGGQGLDLFSMGDVTTAGKFFRIANGNNPRRLGSAWKSQTSGDSEKQTSDGILANSYVTSTFVYDADAKTLTCYQDGYKVNSESNVTPDIDANGTVYIAYNPAKTSRFVCKLDDVQVFAAALNAAQVRRLVQSLETGAVPGTVAASSVSVDAGATFYTPASASIGGLSGAGTVAVGAHGTLAAASASGFTGTVFGPGAFALAEGAVLNCTRDKPALDLTGTLTLPTAATVSFAETPETIAADTRHSYVVARATSLAGATDLSGWTCQLNGTATDKVTFKIKGSTVLAKVRRGLAIVIR